MGGKHLLRSGLVHDPRVHSFIVYLVAVVLLVGSVAGVMLLRRETGVPLDSADGPQMVDPLPVWPEPSGSATPTATAPTSASPTPRRKPSTAPAPAARPSRPRPTRPAPSRAAESQDARPSPPIVAPTAQYAVSSSWDTGFIGGAVLSNPTSTPRRWRVVVRHAAGDAVRVLTGWNAEVTQTGESTIFTGGPLAPGATQSFGFEAVKGVFGPVRPISCTVNYRPCSVA